MECSALLDDFRLMCWLHKDPRLEYQEWQSVQGMTLREVVRAEVILVLHCGSFVFLARNLHPVLVCLKVELKDAKESNSNVSLSALLTSMNGLGPQPSSTLCGIPVIAKRKSRMLWQVSPTIRCAQSPTGHRLSVRALWQNTKAGFTGTVRRIHLPGHGHLGKLCPREPQQE